MTKTLLRPAFAKQGILGSIEQNSSRLFPWHRWIHLFKYSFQVSSFPPPLSSFLLLCLSHLPLSPFAFFLLPPLPSLVLPPPSFSLSPFPFFLPSFLFLPFTYSISFSISTVIYSEFSIRFSVGKDV